MFLQMNPCRVSKRVKICPVVIVARADTRSSEWQQLILKGVIDAGIEVPADPANVSISIEVPAEFHQKSAYKENSFQ